MQKRAQLIFLSLCITIILPSCVVYNSTKEEKNNICSLHNIKMKKTIVKTQYGLTEFYYNDSFPNAKMPLRMGCVVPVWPTGRFAKNYYCNICNGLKNQCTNQ